MPMPPTINTRTAPNARGRKSFARQSASSARMGFPAPARTPSRDSARVNKALLYYYFKGKQGLYAAAVEEVSGGGGEERARCP